MSVEVVLLNTIKSHAVNKESSVANESR